MTTATNSPERPEREKGVEFSTRFQIEEREDGCRVSTGSGKLIAICPDMHTAECVGMALVYFQKSIAQKE